MKNAMAMTAFNRPEYLDAVLVSLANNAGREEYMLHFSVEPANPDVLKSCQSVTWMPANVHLNEKIYGVRKNPYEMLSRIFDAGYENVLYLEDDVELANDAVALANWYWDLPERNNYLCLNLYNHDSVPSADAAAVFGGQRFSALGMGITRHQWFTHFKPNWWADPRGWDFCFTAMISSGMQVLQPRISRSRHIGRFGGVHYRAKMHDHLYVNNHMYVGAKVGFSLEK